MEKNELILQGSVADIIKDYLQASEEKRREVYNKIAPETIAAQRALLMVKLGEDAMLSSAKKDFQLKEIADNIAIQKNVIAVCENKITVLQSMYDNVHNKYFGKEGLMYKIDKQTKSLAAESKSFVEDAIIQAKNFQKQRNEAKDVNLEMDILDMCEYNEEKADTEAMGGFHSLQMGVAAERIVKTIGELEEAEYKRKRETMDLEMSSLEKQLSVFERRKTNAEKQLLLLTNKLDSFDIGIISALNTITNALDPKTQDMPAEIINAGVSQDIEYETTSFANANSFAMKNLSTFKSDVSCGKIAYGVTEENK